MGPQNYNTSKTNILLFFILCCLIGCTSSTTSNSYETTNLNFASGATPDLKQTATEKEAARFAWDTFLGINEFTPSGSTQWENYKEAFDIFLPDAVKPTPWGEPTPSNIPPCETTLSSTKTLRVTSKVSPVINETDQAVGGVLVDRNGNLVHYEVYMNKPMFTYVLDNDFYNAVKQAGSKIDFPVGSMELKAAWRILDPKLDDISRYHTAKAIIYIPDSLKIGKNDCLPASVKNKIADCSEQLVGLVGLHIVYKTPSNPNFTWMTFEQVDNVDSHQLENKLIPSSFRNEKTAIPTCPENSRQCNCPDQETSQITRQNSIPDWVKNVNKDVRDSLQLKGSIWSNYQLIGIQWARDNSRIGNPVLTNLANTSMETFNQTASSCIGCHAFARSSNPTILSDFSWVMGRAQNPKTQLPAPNGAAVLKYVMRENPYKSWGSWPDDKWNLFSKATAGENPHGNSIRIYVNDIALDYYNQNKGKLPENPVLPLGSIVLKENYRTVQPNPVQPSDLVELTIMYKAKDPNGKANWFWSKARPYGPVDIAGFNVQACSSCHSNWKGNGDGMLSFNFGKRPVITSVPYPNSGSKHAYTKKEIDAVKKYMVASE